MLSRRIHVDSAELGGVFFCPLKVSRNQLMKTSAKRLYRTPKPTRKKKNFVIIGAQWGDEGKAKMVDVLTEKVDLVARYQGGSNAGHTVVTAGKKFVFHQIP